MTKIADALKPAIINYIYEQPEFVSVMQDSVASGIQEIMGAMDEDLMFEIVMLVFDQIELK
jgi:hypothetical protein